MVLEIFVVLCVALTKITLYLLCSNFDFERFSNYMQPALVILRPSEFFTRIRPSDQFEFETPDLEDLYLTHPFLLDPQLKSVLNYTLAVRLCLSSYSNNNCSAAYIFYIWLKSKEKSNSILLIQIIHEIVSFPLKEDECRHPLSYLDFCIKSYDK